MKVKFKERKYTEPTSPVVAVGYFDKYMNPTDKDSAVLVKVVYESGEVLFGMVKE